MNELTPIEELTKLLFEYRSSRTTLQDILTDCYACGSPLNEEIFWNTDREQAIIARAHITGEIMAFMSALMDNAIGSDDELFYDDEHPDENGQVRGTFATHRNQLRWEIRQKLAQLTNPTEAGEL